MNSPLLDPSLILDEDDFEAFHHRDHELENNLFGNELGGGFGHALNEEGFEQDDELIAKDHPSSEDGYGVATEFSTSTKTRQRNNTSHLGRDEEEDDGSRLSLAFELASAHSPQRGEDANDLMRSLGFDDDEDEHLRHDRLEELNGFGESNELAQVDFGSMPEATSASPRSGPSDSTTAARRPAQQATRSTHVSRASVASMGTATDADHPDFISSLGIEELMKGFNAELDESSKITRAFVSHLKKHTNTEAVTEVSTTNPTTAEADSRWIDRQPVVETLATSLLKSMNDHTRSFEIQFRDLAEVERTLGRNEIGWQSALGKVDELVWDDEQDQEEELKNDHPGSGLTNGDGIPVSDSLSSLDSVQFSESLSPSTEHSSSQFKNPQFATPIRNGRISSRSVSASMTALNELTSLRTVTLSLTSTLSSLHEMTQVNQASSSDASRKLRALRAQASSLKEDLNVLEKAEEFVEEYEKNRLADERSRRISERVREEMKEAERVLDEGWKRAQEMLTISVK